MRGKAFVTRRHAKKSQITIAFINSLPASFFYSGTEAGIRLYLDEIVSITCPALTSHSWTTKAQAAVTISAIAQKLGRNKRQIFTNTNKHI